MSDRGITRNRTTDCALVILLLMMFAIVPAGAAEPAAGSAAKSTQEKPDEPGAAPSDAAAEEVETAKPRLEVYGFVMTDAGYNAGRIDPDWFDVVRPTKLPGNDDEFGVDGNAFFSVRQTRFGVKSWVPTKLGEAFGIFEFELFGVGADAGQTTFRLRHAYFELGQFGVGQYWSPFMDIDVFPNSLEYWGPSGMVFFRNIQVRWMPVRGDTRVTVALERPGASGDQGQYDENIAPGEVVAHFPVPDLSAEFRLGRPWGYFEVAGILRYIGWEDVTPFPDDLSGSATGWGVNLSSNVKLGKTNTLKLQVVYGEGVENYMNDATADIAVVADPTNPNDLRGVTLPVLGVVAFLDHNWNDEWSTSVGYSLVDIDNASGQTADAFSRGQYALVNLLHYPTPNIMVGGELQYGSRENFDDGWSYNDYRVQFSFRYNFSHTLGGTR